MVQTRKHRNMEEKLAVVNEVMTNLQHLPIPPDNPAIVQLMSVLDAYVVKKEGSLAGSINAEDFGCTIDYFLPTRRIEKQVVRIKKAT